MNKKLSRVGIALIVAVASIPLAFAQTGVTLSTPTTNGSVNPRVDVPGPAMTGVNLHLAPSDRAFLDKDAQGSAYERELAEIAVRKASDPKVKQFAAMIVGDHNEYNTALQSVGQDYGATLPTAPDRDQAQKLSQFAKMDGKQFDTAFVQEMARINKQDIDEAQQEADATMNPDIRDFIIKYQPMDQKHLQDAQQLQS
jgi:putative membrane protein